MHSFGYRLNALLTFSVTILAIMCGIVSLTDNLNTPSPSAEIQVHLFACTHSWICVQISDLFSSFMNPFGFFQMLLSLISVLLCLLQIMNINWFQKQPQGNDEVILFPLPYLLFGNIVSIHLLNCVWYCCCLIICIFILAPSFLICLSG